jgi:putative addiction module killer protein
MDLALRLIATREFVEWKDSLSRKLLKRVDARVDNMRLGVFVDSRSLGDRLFELRWTVGMRVYFSRKRVAGIDIILLWGGFKGTQPADIEFARRLKRKYEIDLEENED